MELLLLLVFASVTPKDRKHFCAILSKFPRNMLRLSRNPTTYFTITSLKDYFGFLSRNKPIFILL